MGKMKTHEEYVQQVSKINPNIEVMDLYQGGKVSILHKCKIDGCEWMTKPIYILRGNGCPVCAIKSMAKTKTKTHEQYVKEVAAINPNIEVVEEYIDCYTRIKHKCKICNHIWTPLPTNIIQGAGCPNCYKNNRQSRAELKIYYYIKKYFSDAISGYQDKDNELHEIDIYIPSLKFAIEYDGKFYHQNVDRDKRKDDICQNMNIKLVRIREYGCPTYKSSCGFIFLYSDSEKELAQIITWILEAMGIKRPDVNFDRDIKEINNLFLNTYKNNSLADVFPDIAAEWHPIKNGKLQPSCISYGSTDRVWWKCINCGYEWVKEINRRTSCGYGCPKCASRGVQRAVYCVELDMIFKNMMEAERQTGVGHRNISSCCRGRTKSTTYDSTANKTLHWFYVEDQLDKNKTIIKGALTLGLIENSQYENYLNAL